MPQLACPSCRSLLNLGDNMAGAEVRCPACKTVIQAPRPVPRPAPPAAAPAAPPAVDFDFGGSAPSSTPAAGNAFESLESADPDVQLGRARGRKPAAAMNQALTMLIALPCIGGVLQMFNLGINGAPVFAQVFFLTFYLVFVAALLALPVTFMALGTSALQRFSSLGLAIAGAVTALLMGGLLALGALLLVSSIAFGNLLGLLGAPLMGVGAYFCIRAGVQMLRACNDPDIREAFRARREETRAR